ncbi:18586_t:CDS:2, partial [Gigaspora rosea]
MKTHQPEMTTKATHPENAKWLSSEGFTPVVNKRSNTAKKSKSTDKSRPHEAEHRPFPYSKKGRGRMEQSHLVSEITMKFGNSDHLLVACTLSSKSEMY